MGELLHLGLLIALCAAAVVAAVALGVVLLNETRRLKAAFRAGLEAEPDAAIIAHGTGRGAAMSLTSGLVVTAWDRGGWRLTYPLEALVGAEVDIDGEVAARVMRGEPRRLLDRPGAAQREVRLRLIFDDPRHPDFELTLWPCRESRASPQMPRDAAAEANRWVGRVEAVLKRTGPGAIRAAAPTVRMARPSLPEALDEGDLFEDDEDADVLTN